MLSAKVNFSSREIIRKIFATAVAEAPVERIRQYF